ncbi:hypothetical protein [uncultured Alistipes sp.]|uniref:hypothetical protein n=1 Tax=uncultured Alistipes sp. TaxID=538949 RepID=UPI002625CAAF|nr:hypothetical protein [uncultured Alistipes sp.]
MKKIYCYPLIMIFSLSISVPALSMNDNKEPTKIAIQDIPGSGTKTPRSVSPTAPTAYGQYDPNFSLLEVEFFREIGPVAIYVLNSMNQCIARYDCNTAEEDVARINFQAVEDETYTIRIVGSNYEGVGYLFVQ